MKKVINVGKVLLLTIVFILGVSNICFADVYGMGGGLNPISSDPPPAPDTSPMSPIEETIQAIPFQLRIVLRILEILFFITFVCMLVAKVCEVEELLKKCNNILENLFYYILVLIGIMSVFGLKEFNQIFMWMAILEVLISLVLRIKFKMKKESYIFLFIYFLVAIFVYKKIIWMQ